MENKLYVVKFKQNEDNQEGLVELKLNKNNMLDVLTYLRDELQVKDTIIESIDEK